jgi:hypothetical protein
MALILVPWFYMRLFYAWSVIVSFGLTNSIHRYKVQIRDEETKYGGMRALIGRV